MAGESVPAVDAILDALEARLIVTELIAVVRRYRRVIFEGRNPPEAKRLGREIDELLRRLDKVRP